MDLQELRDAYEIDIKALFITICQRWRLIVLCGLAGALLAIGFTVFRSVRASANASVAAGLDTTAVISLDTNIYGIAPTDVSLPGRFRTAIANYEAALQKAGDDESYVVVAKVNRDAIQTMLQDIEETREYLDNSLLYKSNSPTGARQTILLTMDGSSLSPAEAEMAIQPYVLYLNDDQTYAALAQKWGVDAKFINETVWLDGVSAQAETPTQSITLDMNVDIDEPLYQSGIESKVPRYYKLTLSAENTQRMQELQDYVLSSLATYAESHSDMVHGGLQVVEVSNQTAYSRSGQEDYDNVQFVYAQLDTLANQYFQFESSNADIIKELLGDAVESDVATSLGDVSAGGMSSDKDAKESGIGLGSLIKYGIVGLFVGVFGCMGALFLYYALTGVVLSEGEIDDLYRLRHLVTLRGEESNKHRTKLDTWLRTRKEDADYRSMDEAQRYAVLEKKVRSYCDEEASNFLVVGTSHVDPLEEIAHKLALHMKDCSFGTTESLNSDMQSLDDLESCNGVILVLNVAHSRHDAIYKDMETIQYYNKEIIGTVAVI